MANYFDITRPEGLNVVKLDSSGRAEVQYTVKNVSGIRREGRALLVSIPPSPGGPVEKNWVKPDPQPQRMFDPGQSLPFVVKIAVPPKSPEGTCKFRMDMVLVERTDEGDRGPEISFTIPKRETPPPFKWWIPVAAVVALAIIGVLVWVLLPKGVAVPDLKGELPADANNALNLVGLELDPTQDLIESTPDLAGKIADQTPAAGTKLKKGGTVKVSLGSVMVSVPDLQTLPLDQATAALNKAGLQLGTVTTRVVPNTTGGFVLSQSIAKGTPVKSNTPVDLTVAQLMVSVPHLATLPVGQAIVALQNAKLVLAGISGNQYTAAVLSSSPAEGTLVNVGTPVTLTVPSNYCAGLACYISGQQYQTNVIKPSTYNSPIFQQAQRVK